MAVDAPAGGKIDAELHCTTKARTTRRLCFCSRVYHWLVLDRFIPLSYSCYEEAASRLFEKGLNPVEITTNTGHKDTKMLMRYTHLRVENLDRLGLG